MENGAGEAGGSVEDPRDCLSNAAQAFEVLSRSVSHREERRKWKLHNERGRVESRRPKRIGRARRRARPIASERENYFWARRRRRTAAATIPAPAASTANEAGSGTELPPPPPPGAGGHRYLPIMGMLQYAGVPLA